MTTFGKVLIGGFLMSLWLLLLLRMAALAAPTPPQPPRLTTKLLAGARWHYEYGAMTDGWIQFNTDGTYDAQHHPQYTSRYCGTWELTGATVVLMECSFDPTRPGERACVPTRYEFTFSTDYPVLRGVASTGCTVILSNPKR